MEGLAATVVEEEVMLTSEAEVAVERAGILVAEIGIRMAKEIARTRIG